MTQRRMEETKPNGHDRTGATAALAPLTPEEATTYRNLAALTGAELANLAADSLGRAGLQVPTGTVRVDWNGALLWRVPLDLGRRIHPRVLFAALGGGSEADRAIALALVLAEVRALADTAESAIRDYAGQVRGAVRRSRHAPAVDNTDGRGVAGPAEAEPATPGRILLVRG